MAKSSKLIESVVSGKSAGEVLDELHKEGATYDSTSSSHFNKLHEPFVPARSIKIKADRIQRLIKGWEKKVRGMPSPKVNFSKLRQITSDLKKADDIILGCLQELNKL